MIMIMLTDIFEILCDKGALSLRYDPGTLLFSRRDKVGSLFLLEHGEVKLSRSLITGKELVLHRARAPGIVAEASVYSATYHCDAVCLSHCTIVRLPVSRFLHLIENNTELSRAWSAHLARTLQSTRFRSEILTMKKVSERLDAWFDWHGDKLPPKGRWRQVAAEIGVSPEALYRELARRRR